MNKEKERAEWLAIAEKYFDATTNDNEEKALRDFLSSAERIFEGASTLVIRSASGIESDANLRLSVLMMFVKIGSKPCSNR